VLILCGFDSFSVTVQNSRLSQ
jgi:hypothetical protein